MNVKFSCLEQRMVNTYLDTFPCFMPSESGPGIRAQEQFYQFMHGLYQRLSLDPALLFGTLHEDDAYSHRFNKGADNKPKLRDLMRKAIKEVDTVLITLFQAARSGQVVSNTLVVNASVKVSKKHGLLFEQLGLHQKPELGRFVWCHNDYDEMFQAMTWMATKPNASLLAFSRCLFREGYPYASDVYARLSGNAEAFRRLERYLMERGYTRMDNWDGTTALDYFKTHGDEKPTKGGFQYGIHHTGISASYDLLMDKPQVFGLCIPRMKEILTAFDCLPPRVQDFVVTRTKKCDACRYCVQTDKTGKRPLAAQLVSYQGREVSLCPYFPGYNYCEPELSDDYVDDMIAMLGAMDRLFDEVFVNTISVTGLQKNRRLPMNENISTTLNSILPISQIIPFIPSENGFRVFEMPAVRFIGKSIRDTLYSDPNPIPAFWTEYFARGYHLVTDALPHVIPNRLAHFFDYSSDTQQYTYLICVACPAGTPVPDGYAFRDAPAALVCYGATNENGGDPYAEGNVQEELKKLGLTLLGPLCEFYPDLGKPHFCVLFTCQPA